MTSRIDAIAAVIQSGRGTRAYSLDNREAEQVLSIALALLVELAASNDRIDRLEREIATLKGQSLDALREAPLDADAQKERQEALEAMQLRVLRILMDPRDGG
ncbi:hypothetical protein [Flavisphingomonas formosensis]|uniref:hypothetical protein n=1 Tax=Flavisphingomonas formosensis TaxID=861534 RepID=UPI0012FB2780|nr:hypothetical protein [Sphingomonas formosensis]